MRAAGALVRSRVDLTGDDRSARSHDALRVAAPSSTGCHCRSGAASCARFWDETAPERPPPWRLLAGVLRAVGGSARINGHDVIAERCAVAASIGLLPEAATGFSRLTVAEFLRFCGESRGLAGRTLAAAIDRAGERVHAREVRDTLMGELSKGWRQRGVARTGAPARPSGADPGRTHRWSRSGRAEAHSRVARKRLAGQGGAGLDARAGGGGGDCDSRGFDFFHRAGTNRRRRRSVQSRRRARPTRIRVSSACRRRAGECP